MAYKPYKPKKEKDIYARYDGKNTKANNYDSGSVKLFGFRLFCCIGNSFEICYTAKARL